MIGRKRERSSTFPISVRPAASSVFINLARRVKSLPTPALDYLITLIGRAKKCSHARRFLFFPLEIGKNQKKVFVVCDEAPPFLRGPRFQPA